VTDNATKRALQMCDLAIGSTHAKVSVEWLWLKMPTFLPIGLCHASPSCAKGGSPPTGVIGSALMPIFMPSPASGSEHPFEGPLKIGGVSAVGPAHPEERPPQPPTDRTTARCILSAQSGDYV
jgi:hypothetical protein